MAEKPIVLTLGLSWRARVIEKDELSQPSKRLHLYQTCSISPTELPSPTRGVSRDHQIISYPPTGAPGDLLDTKSVGHQFDGTPGQGDASTLVQYTGTVGHQVSWIPSCQTPS